MKLTNIKKVAYYFAILLMISMVTIFTNFPDWDLWARLAVGSIFFQTGGVLKHDIFAYSPVKNLWIDHEWGSGVIFFFLIDHFGDIGLFALKAVILFLIFLLIDKIIKLNTDKYVIEPFYPVIVGLSILPVVQNTIRSQMFTFLFFTLWIYILERVRRGENRLLWIIPATMILWANIHGGFPVGIGLLFAYALGEYLNKHDSLKYFAVLIITVLVTLINPYGIKYWPYIYEAVTMPRPLILEWQPLMFNRPVIKILGMAFHVHTGAILFMILMLIIGLKSFLGKAKADWVKILLLGMTLYMGLKHQRHILFFIITASVLLYHQYAAFFTLIFNIIKEKFGEKALIWNKIFKVSLSAAFIIFAGILFMQVIRFSSLKFVVRPNLYPVGSMEFIKQNNLSGNLATTYNWGSYALWKLYPQCRVLIDGRSEETYPNKVIDITAVFSEKLNNNWIKVIEHLHTDIILVPKNVYNPYDLELLNDWQIVYDDAISVLLLPKSKLKKIYVRPNFTNPVYTRENLAKHINLN